MILIILNIIFASRKFNGKKSDVIIILGCNLKSYFINKRIEKGVQLYNNKMATNIIVTGLGKGEISEALGMKRKLIKLGIEEDAILLEERAKNTYENLIFSKAIMNSKNFKSAIIVSDGYHLARVKMICKNINLKATFESYRYKNYRKYYIFMIFRESIAFIKDFFVSKLSKK
ncbi:YdcF family protein [Eubacterium multiforme]|uniref:Uncharacterized SAM-binding protein YcdF (DUF218 family) n=1 Tax=Eubacterium multiforme TaxID=83339 RepID=A0ABT9UVD1_9FIRM|nr:YdcF family protein [Eubacterium multiforme]MDQ0150234.1 uncharacterized SAM-binding protein YcdF (DUF218 family) [Eubacterium multiforme]